MEDKTKTSEAISKYKADIKTIAEYINNGGNEDTFFKKLYVEHLIRSFFVNSTEITEFACISFVAKYIEEHAKNEDDLITAVFKTIGVDRPSEQELLKGVKTVDEKIEKLINLIKGNNTYASLVSQILVSRLIKKN